MRANNCRADEQPVVVSRFILMHLRFLQLVGMCPVSLRLNTAADSAHDALNKIQRNRTCHRWHITWLCLHIAAFSIYHIAVIIDQSRVVYYEDSFGKMTDILKIFTAIVAHIVTLVELLCKRRELHSFLQIYSKLHRSWAALSTREQVYVYRRLVFTNITFLLTLWSIQTAHLYEIRHRPDWVLFYCYFLPSSLVCFVRFLQLILYLELIRCELVQLNVKIEHLAAYSRRFYSTEKQLAKAVEAEICGEIKQIMVIYHEIYQMTEFFKLSNGASIACNYLNTYITMLANCYWIYWLIYKEDNVNEYLIIIPSAMTIFQLLLTARNCMYAAHIVGHNIHKIRHPIENINIAIRIQNLSYQLMHERIIIDAYGLFVISSNMARSILGTITTYMIFFIQSMPKFPGA